MTRGWRNESHRHSLSAKGIRTSPRNRFVAFGSLLSFVRKHGVFEGDPTLEFRGLVDGRDVGYVKVTYDMDEGSMELDSVFVSDEFRRRGFGDLLVEEALGFADENKLVTELLVEPFGDEWDRLEYENYPLWLAEKERLRIYYRRFGFLSVSSGSLMVRPPQSI